MIGVGHPWSSEDITACSGSNFTSSPPEGPFPPTTAVFPAFLEPAAVILISTPSGGDCRRLLRGNPVYGRKTIPLEELLWRFRHSRGLFLLGAGASAGIVPFGPRFMAAPPLEFLDKWTALSASRTKQDLLTRRAIEAAMPSLLARRGERWFDMEMAKAVLAHMPNGVSTLHLVHELAKARLKQLKGNLRYRNYGIFELFPPTVLLNYNLDGIASDICGGDHRVIPVHGTVKAHLGAPDIADLLGKVRDFGFDIGFDDLLLCVPEPAFGQPGRRELVARLSPMWSFAGFRRGLRLQLRLAGSDERPAARRPRKSPAFRAPLP